MRQPDPSVTQELVEKAQAGDTEAFGLLLERYRGRLESLIHLRMGPQLRGKVEVDDVLQETCFSAYRSVERFRWTDEGSFFRWIGTIAEHTIQGLVRHHLQTKKRDPTRERSLDAAVRNVSGGDAELRFQLRDSGTPPGTRLRRQERLERLEAALAQVLPDHREVILLSTIQGLPMSEIVERMGRSRKAVSMLLLRALRDLRLRFGTTDSFHLPERPGDLGAGGDGGADGGSRVEDGGSEGS